MFKIYKLQNIHKPGTNNESCDNQYCTYQYVGVSLRT